MKNTKSNILSTSKHLFNQQGYSNVTIRMIALELKISSGNLNYHFKKREDILEALYFEMVEAFDARVKQLGDKQITLETVKEDILLSLNRMVEYRFFWTDLYNLLRLNKKIKSHFQNVYHNRLKGYEYLFDVLIEKNLMRDFEFSKESQFLIERMISYSNTWLYNSFIYNKSINEDYIELQSTNLLVMLYPYLTNRGKHQYQKLLPNYFE
ncbi:TetR/AcrR family transcriptional regulator [Aquimarina atlantica]|nr:TetR/AcrR family transcriptional regulator [Aquimarina atlantica]